MSNWQFKVVASQMAVGIFPYFDQNRKEDHLEFEAIPEGIRDGILINQMLHPKNLSQLNWLDRLELVSETNREEALIFLVKSRFEIDKQTSRVPVWILEACEFASKNGFTVQPHWIEILKLCIAMVEQNLTNYRGSIAQWGRDWLNTQPIVTNGDTK